MEKLKHPGFIFLVLVLATFLVYQLTAIKSPTYFNHFIVLSERMMHGGVDLINPPPHLELSIDERTGKKYVPYPPLPAVLIAPLVYFNIFDKSQTDYALMFGALDTGLFFLLTARFFNSKRIGIILSICLGFGTSFWYLASDGSSWYLSHVFAVFFLILALLAIDLHQGTGKLEFSKNENRWLVSGTFLGCAYMTRDPTILAAIFFLGVPLIHAEGAITHASSQSKKVLQILWSYRRQYFHFLYPVFICLCIIAYYNYIRFGTIRPVQHEKIPHLLELHIFNKGFLNIAYIPRNVVFFFTKMPLPYDKFPYYKPSLEGMSYILVSPYILCILAAQWKKRWVQLALLTILAMLMLVFMNGSNGFSQFGYRYAMEATLFLLLIFGTCLQRKYAYLSYPLIILSIAICFWGIYFTRVLQIYGF